VRRWPWIPGGPASAARSRRRAARAAARRPPIDDDAARGDLARAWGRRVLPAEPGRDTGQILAAAAAGDIGALVVAGVDPADLPGPAAALAALESTEFIVSLELRASAVTDRADVVFPVAAVSEKAARS